MSSSTKYTRRPITVCSEREIHAEIQAADWGKPFQKSIEELGIAMGSNIGPNRKRNEDRMVVAQVVSAANEPFSVAIVCDGVGGSEMGDTAAAMAISIFLSELAGLREHRVLSMLLIDLIRKVDDGVRAELHGRGTTTLSAIITSINGQFAAASVGDSRLFSWSTDGIFEQVSVDDTLENELRDLKIKDASVLDARGLRGSLSQAIGEPNRASAGLKIETYAKDRFHKGAILATDGIWRSVEGAFKAIALNTSTAFDLIRRSIAFATWTGGVDNASLIAIESLEIFSKIPTTSSRKDSHSSLVLWICDSKTIFREVIPSTSAESQPFEQTRRAEKKQKRRPDSARKDTPNAKTQMDLISVPKQSDVRPNIEISTDEDR